MKVGVFFAGEIDEVISTVLRICRVEGIDASAYRFRREWLALDPGEAAYNFGSITHAFLRGTAEVLLAEWLPFVAGFFLGRERSASFLGPLDSNELPRFLNDLPTKTDPEELRSYLHDERVLVERRSTLEAAREEIRSAGLPETDEAFAQAGAVGDLSSVENFLRIGFSPDCRDSKGVPLLVLSIRNNHPDIAETLLRKGADPNNVSEDRGTTALMEAASLGNAEVVSMLLSGRADPDIKSKSGRTALMLAVSEGKREAAADLLSAGADPDIVDDLGMTALAYAKLFKLDDLFGDVGKT